MHSPALLDLFLVSDPSLCSAVALPPLRNFNLVFSVSIGFPSSSKNEALTRLSNQSIHGVMRKKKTGVKEKKVINES